MRPIVTFEGHIYRKDEIEVVFSSLGKFLLDCFKDSYCTSIHRQDHHIAHLVNVQNEYSAEKFTFFCVSQEKHKQCKFIEHLPKLSCKAQ